MKPETSYSEKQQVVGPRLRREAPSQRRFHRLTVPLWVEIDAVEYRTADWSLGGFSILAYDGDVVVAGETLQVLIHVPFQGFDIAFEVTARVVRYKSQNGLLAGEYVDLDERQRGLLEFFSNGLLAGELASFDDTIRRIDIPMTPVSSKPDLRPGVLVPQRRRRLKALLLSSVYLTLGAIVSVYLMVTLWTALFRLQVDSAVVNAPVEAVRTPRSGFVAEVLANEGDAVDPDAPLFRVEDDEVARQLLRAANEVKEHQVTADKFDDLVAAEKDKLDLYAQIGARYVDEAKANLAVARSRLALDKASWQRAQRLHANDLQSDSELEAATARYENAEAEHEAAQAQLAVARDALTSIEKGRFFVGDRLDGELPETETLAAAARRDMQLALERLAAVQEQNARLQIRAAFPGRVAKLLKAPGSVVERGDPILLLEHDRPRQILAYLTQSEIVRVGLGREALVHVPALDRRFKARVVEIDRTSGVIEESNVGYRWQIPEGRTARVALEVADLGLQEIREQLPAGLPVVVSFPKQPVNELISRIWPFRRAPTANREG